MTRTTPGKEVAYRHWGLSAPRAVFLLVHGLGAHSGRWEAMADFFLRNGISSYAIEFPNPAQPDKGVNKSGYFGFYSDSILELSGIIKARNPENKIFLVGESMGALISFLLIAEQPDPFSGLACLSPAFGNKMRLSGMDYLKIAVLMLYDRGKLFKLPFDPSMCTRDARYLDEMSRDPREYHEAPAGLLFEILAAQRKAVSAGKKIKLPLLFLAAGSDMIADSEITAKIFGALATKERSMVEFPGMYHSLSVESGKEAVFEELLNWVEKRLASR